MRSALVGLEWNEHRALAAAALELHGSTHASRQQAATGAPQVTVTTTWLDRRFATDAHCTCSHAGVPKSHPHREAGGRKGCRSSAPLSSALTKATLPHMIMTVKNNRASALRRRAGALPMLRWRESMQQNRARDGRRVGVACSPDGARTLRLRRQTTALTRAHEHSSSREPLTHLGLQMHAYRNCMPRCKRR